MHLRVQLPIESRTFDAEIQVYHRNRIDPDGPAARRSSSPIRQAGPDARIELELAVIRARDVDLSPDRQFDLAARSHEGRHATGVADEDFVLFDNDRIEAASSETER